MPISEFRILSNLFHGSSLRTKIDSGHRLKIHSDVRHYTATKRKKINYETFSDFGYIPAGNLFD